MRIRFIYQSLKHYTFSCRLNGNVWIVWKLVYYTSEIANRETDDTFARVLMARGKWQLTFLEKCQIEKHLIFLTIIFVYWTAIVNLNKKYFYHVLNICEILETRHSDFLIIYDQLGSSIFKERNWWIFHSL